MWRFEATHKRSQTEYLEQVIDRIRFDEALYNRAEAMLNGASKAEPLIADCLRTPQDIRYHAEGPFVRDHLRSILMGLYAIVEEKIHLIDIEEFRRMKGYEAEIEELEETIRENAALFEVFALCHDAAKWSTVRFNSRKHSRGRELGFDMDKNTYAYASQGDRAKLRDRYLQLFSEFEQNHPDLSPRELEREFFLVYEIEAHYPHHARQIHAPVYEELLDRFVVAHQLSSRDQDLLIDLISHHMEFNKDFMEVRPERVRRYMYLCQARGWDGDDFMDLLQGCILLDMVFGSTRLSAHGYWHEVLPLTNALESEHRYAPMRRVEKMKERESREKSKQNNVFKDVGLDGIALMELLGMEPGPKFGQALRRIHSAIIGKGDMPTFGKGIDHEIEKRALAYYKKVFVKGE